MQRKVISSSKVICTSAQIVIEIQGEYGLGEFNNKFQVDLLTNKFLDGGCAEDDLRLT